MDKPKFGQFLINNDVIDEIVLFNALLLQEEKQESIVCIAIAEEMMTVSQVMSVFNEQPDTCASFTDMAVSLGYLNTEQVSELLLLQMKTRPLLGQLLVEMGEIDQATLDELLEKFCMLPINIDLNNKAGAC